MLTLEVFLVCAVLSGSAVFGIVGYLIALLAVSVLVLPRVRSVRQPLRPWVTAIALFPLVTYAFARRTRR